LLAQAAQNDPSLTMIIVIVPSVLALIGVSLGVISTIRSGNQTAQSKFVDQLQHQVNHQAEEILALEKRVTEAERKEHECHQDHAQTRAHLQEAQNQLAKVEYELRTLKKPT